MPHARNLWGFAHHPANLTGVGNGCPEDGQQLPFQHGAVAMAAPSRRALPPPQKSHFGAGEGRQAL